MSEPSGGVDLDALEYLYTNVPQGPWRDDGRGCYVFCGADDAWMICEIRGWGHLTGRGGGQHLTDEDAKEIQVAIGKYIAAVSPIVLSALIQRLREAEQPSAGRNLKSLIVELEKRDAEITQMQAAVTQSARQVRTLEKQVAELQAELARARLVGG